MPDERNRYATRPSDLQTNATTTEKTAAATAAITPTTVPTANNSATIKTTAPVVVKPTVTNKKSSGINATLPHVYINPPKVVNEQKAKNESESDYKAFETTTKNNDTIDDAVTTEKPVPTKTIEVVATSQSSGQPANIPRESNASSDDGKIVPSENNSGSPYDGKTDSEEEDNGEGEDTRSSVRKRLMAMSESEKREFLEKYLANHNNEAPYTNGDKKW